MCVYFRKALSDDSPSSEHPGVKRTSFDIALFGLISKHHGDLLPAWLTVQASEDSVIPKELPVKASRRYQQIYKVR